MNIEDLKLRDLRKYIDVGYCRSRHTFIGCRFRPDVANAKPDDKVPFGCEDCLKNELERIDRLASKKARLIEYVTWHYQSIVYRFHRDVHMKSRDFLLWRMWMCRIGKVYFDEIEFVMKAATEEIIDRRLKKEALRIDRDASRGVELDFAPYDLVDVSREISLRVEDGRTVVGYKRALNV